MRNRVAFGQGRLTWGRVTLALWVAVAYLTVLYVALRWGGEGDIGLRITD